MEYPHADLMRLRGNIASGILSPSTGRHRANAGHGLDANAAYQSALLKDMHQSRPTVKLNRSAGTVSLCSSTGRRFRSVGGVLHANG